MQDGMRTEPPSAPEGILKMSEQFENEISKLLQDLEQRRIQVVGGRRGGKMLLAMYQMIEAICTGKDAIMFHPDFVVMTMERYEELMGEE